MYTGCFYDSLYLIFLESVTIMNISINNFKTHCFKLAQKVCDEHIELILTKHGKPLVRVSPLHTSQVGQLNMLSGTAIMKDDLIEPVDVTWSSMTEI